MNAQKLEKLLADVTEGEWSNDVDLSEYGWSLDTEGENTYCGIGTSLAGPIAIVAVPLAFGMDDELDANVELITLAPTLARRVIAAEKLAEALREAQAQLEATHDDAFNQAAGRGIQTTDGRPFSCLQINVCSEVAGRAKKALTEWEAAQ